MKIVSIRQGFATNSSSMHSVVRYGNSWNSKTKQEIAELYETSIYGGETEFGWSYDTFSDLGSIINYALLLFIQRYGESIKPDEYSHELQTIINAALINNVFSGYIDHQSIEDYDCVGTSEEKFWQFVHEVGKIVTDNDNH